MREKVAHGRSDRERETVNWKEKDGKKSRVRVSKGEYFENPLGYFQRENQNLIVLLEHSLRSHSMVQGSLCRTGWSGSLCLGSQVLGLLACVGSRQCLLDVVFSFCCSHCGGFSVFLISVWFT